MSKPVKSATKFPPLGFSQIEPNLFRIVGSFTKHSIPFLEQLSLRAIINCTRSPLDDVAMSFMEDNKISYYDYSDVDIEDLLVLNDVVRNSVKILIDSSMSPILLVGCNRTYIDLIIIACLRRLLDWNMFSVISEIRFLTGSNTSLHDLEQYVEHYDIEQIGSLTSVPNSKKTVSLFFYDSYQRAQALDSQIPSGKSGSLVGAANNSSAGDAYVDMPVAAANRNVSDMSVFDLTISLINVVDDDD